MRKRNVTSQPKTVKGRLENYIEPGTGTTVWAFRKENPDGLGYGVPRPLQNGDFVQVFNDAARKQEIWSGEIDLEFTSHAAPLPRAPHITAQVVKGVGPVHGLQKGVDAKEWCDMFVAGKPATFTPQKPNRPSNTI